MRIKNRGKENSGNAREGQSSSEAYTVQSHFAKKIIRAFSIVLDVLEKLLPKKKEAYFTTIQPNFQDTTSTVSTGLAKTFNCFFSVS